MKKTLAVLMLACAGQMFAGGFYLQLGNPEANPTASKMGAVVTIKAVGCHDPAAAKLTGPSMRTSGSAHSSWICLGAFEA